MALKTLCAHARSRKMRVPAATVNKPVAAGGGKGYASSDSRWASLMKPCAAAQRWILKRVSAGPDYADRALSDPTPGHVESGVFAIRTRQRRVIGPWARDCFGTILGPPVNQVTGGFPAPGPEWLKPVKAMVKAAVTAAKAITLRWRRASLNFSTTSNGSFFVLWKWTRRLQVERRRVHQWQYYGATARIGGNGNCKLSKSCAKGNLLAYCAQGTT